MSEDSLEPDRSSWSVARDVVVSAGGVVVALLGVCFVLFVLLLPLFPLVLWWLVSFEAAVMAALTILLLSGYSTGDD